MISYPTTLPGPSSLSLKKAGRKLSASIEGAPISRGRQLSVVTVAQVSWDLSESQAGTFLSWFLDDLSEGRRSFKITLPGDGGNRERQARFTSPLDQSYSGAGGYTISATVEITEA